MKRRRITNPNELVRAGWLVSRAIECFETALRNVHNGHLAFVASYLRSSEDWADMARDAALRSKGIRP